jgi:hypothetical protein
LEHHYFFTHRKNAMEVQPSNQKHLSADVVETVEFAGSNAFNQDDVHWWKQPGLRRLYLLMPFLFLGSTTLGYDGSLLNGLQAMPTWRDCMPYQHQEHYPCPAANLG